MKFILYLVFILVVSSLSVRAQTDTGFLSTAISRFEKQPVVEKVYLHLDKSNYTFGDTIWYKAYAVIGSHHQLSALSKVLYVEFYNPADSLVIRQIVQLHSGTGWGSIALPHNSHQGNYTIKAYTNWMRNFGNEQFYSQQIRVGGAKTTGTAVSESPDLQFFPEGGEMVEGIRSKIAFKAINPSGFGADLNGTISDNEGNAVAEMNTQHAGMGEFALTPQPGKTYVAKISTTNGKTFTVALPIAKVKGYVLAINTSQPDSIYIRIAANDKLLDEQKNSTFFIIAQSNGKVYYTTKGSLQSLNYTARVEKSRFPAGITQFTLFSQAAQPLAERIAYIEGADTLKIGLKANGDAASYQKTAVNINANQNNDQPTQGSFSVAVINESNTSIDEKNESTIENKLLLTSDLKGYIENPNYYFINKTDQTRANLDLLMLTQGYRRFNWKPAPDTSSKKINYQPEASLQLAGILKNKAGKPIAGGKVTLVATTENLLMDTLTDENGNFKFTGLNLIDTQKLVLRARTPKNGDGVTILVKAPDYATITSRDFPNTNIFAAGIPDQILQQDYEKYQQQEKIEITNKLHVLKEVTIKEHVEKKPVITRSANLNGPGNADQVIMGKDLHNCINLSDCLLSRIFGVTFRGGIPYNNRKGRPAALTVIIDGVVTDPASGQMDNLSASDVFSIEVLRSGGYLAIYGSEAPNGAIIITTRRGGEDGYTEALPDVRGIITYPFMGYTPAKIFYTPKYAAKEQLNDTRSTIYWNPNVITDKDGKATLEYLNGGKGIYRIVVEGIDDDGNLGRQVYTYTVK